MADLVPSSPFRAMAIVEVEVQVTTETINTYVSWPVMAAGVALDELADMRITINPMNAFADGGHFIDNFVQNATTGMISFDLTNVTAGAPGSMGLFRVEVERVRN